MGKNQKDKKEGKQENKAAAPSQERKLQEKEIEEKEDTRLKNWGQMTLDGNEKKRKIHLLSIIGEVEGHENASGGSKTTNMTMCFLHWLRSRMMPQWRDS